MIVAPFNIGWELKPNHQTTIFTGGLIMPITAPTATDDEITVTAKAPVAIVKEDLFQLSLTANRIIPVFSNFEISPSLTDTDRGACFSAFCGYGKKIYEADVAGLPNPLYCSRYKAWSEKHLLLLKEQTKKSSNLDSRGAAIRIGKHIVSCGGLKPFAAESFLLSLIINIGWATIDQAFTIKNPNNLIFTKLHKETEVLVN